jgi:hypothetical protein
MITSALLSLVYGLAYLITLPIVNLADVVMSSDFTTAITSANGYLASLNSFLPMDTIINILTLFLVIEGAVLTYKLIMWVIRRIPTQS